MGMFSGNGVTAKKEVTEMVENFERDYDLIAAQYNGTDIFEFRQSRRPSFEKELSSLINRHSLENVGGNTPDFVLATFLASVLEAFGEAAARREQGQTTKDENFGFYVDGYTVSATDVIGEVRVVRYDGKEATIKSRSLTDYFDRRIDREETPG